MATVLGIFKDEDKAKEAINEMKDKGIGEDKISLVAKHQGKEDVEAGGGMEGNNQNLTDGTTTGGALGGIAGVLAGAGLLAIPGVGPILAAGPLAAGLSGAAAGGLTGGLVDYGIDQEAGERYNKQVEGGGVLVAAEDTDQNRINDVAAILKNKGASDVETH